MKIKNRIYGILEGKNPDDAATRIFQIFIMGLILLNVLAIIFETVESVRLRLESFFRVLDLFSVAIFTAEYILRMWTSTLDKRFRKPLAGRLRFALTPLAIVDLLAVLPFYLPMLLPFDLKFIRIIRLFRFFRLFKMARYSRAFSTIGNVFRAKKEELGITVFVVLVLLVLASSLMFFIEHPNQPKVFSSIPASMWWGVATLTTIGYGDVYPVTPLGKFLGAFIAFLGIGVFALPTGILASGFAEELKRQEKGSSRKKNQRCPHCGKRIG